jgi:hypothetical protein
VSSEQINGYTVAYEREELQFPVYLLALIAAVLVAGGLYNGMPLLTALAIVPLTGVFYNLPLLETGRWRIAAGQYGFVLEGHGLIDWRAIDGIDLVSKDDRGAVSMELHVDLKVPVAQALILDWRRRSFLRSLMRLPWSWAAPRKIRVPLDIMDKPAPEIHATLQRMWRYYRGQQPPPTVPGA